MTSPFNNLKYQPSVIMIPLVVAQLNCVRQSADIKKITISYVKAKIRKNTEESIWDTTTDTECQPTFACCL